jgi:hypothetical protein
LIFVEILAIGNSFSQDATRYLHRIARAEGVALNVTNLYIGGCSLERHYRNMLSGERAYELEYNGERTGFRVSLEEALYNRKWDAVTIQQVSHESIDPETYRPYIFALADRIREYAPKAKLLFHETWFYEQNSYRLTQELGFPTEKAMLEKIQAAYGQIAREIGAEGIIPSGTLFGKLREAGIPKLHRDTFHASYGLGRYALGLLWYRYLTGNNVSENPFADPDEPISQEEYTIAKKCVDGLYF